MNNKAAYTLYKNETKQPYFIDKSLILEELFPMVRTGNNHICITRPRRFGKSVMANMIASFFSKAKQSRDLFGTLKISESKEYKKHLNQYAVIHISFNELGGQCNSYRDYIGRIEKRLARDLKTEYPDVELYGDESVVDILLDIFAENDSARFIFVLDEWDFIFHQSFITEDDKKSYLMYLRDLLKDKPYVLLAYMTGILPITKYSSGSELNMFAEFTMASDRRFCEYFGFTSKEVDLLFSRYQKNLSGAGTVTRKGLAYWYDGYYTKSGVQIYNPRSVVRALSDDNLKNYWTSSGPYDEIYFYVKHNVAAIRDDLALLVSETRVPVKICEYAAVSQELKTKDEIFSAMLIYGFLSYQDGQVSVPNKELMDQFSMMLKKEPSFGYVYQLAKESERMLKATLAGDTQTMEQILELAHDTEVPLLSYSNETEFTAVVNLVYLAARDRYRVEREERAGVGYVDFIFYPEINPDEDGIILELKVDHTPDEAISQIKEKKYAMRFRGKTGETPKYTCRILGVGISYSKMDKKHHCKIEVLKEKG